jgi:hypothetical protein
MVVHTVNLSYSGGGDRVTASLRPALTKGVRPCLRKKNTLRDAYVVECYSNTCKALGSIKKEKKYSLTL